MFDATWKCTCDSLIRQSMKSTNATDNSDDGRIAFRSRVCIFTCSFHVVMNQSVSIYVRLICDVGIFLSYG